MEDLRTARLNMRDQKSPKLPLDLIVTMIMHCTLAMLGRQKQAA